MENAEEIFHFLEEFSKRKPKTIPQELNEYLAYVARTGDPVYQWPLVKCLFKEKLLSVITDFYETSPGIEIPPYPNVDPFNYDIMKNSLLERLDSFTSAPFTVQRICELLTFPRKQYHRVDKFMRAIEKNILVVSTREPGAQRQPEPENGEPIEPIVNGSDNNSEYNVDVEMEDMSWKNNAEQQQSSEPQPGSSDAHISVDDIEARLKAKQEAPMDTQEKIPTQYESVTPPELNITADEQPVESKTEAEVNIQTEITVEEPKVEATTSSSTSEEPKADVEMKTEVCPPTLIIPEIKVDDAEMTEQRLSEESASDKLEETQETTEKEQEPTANDTKPLTEPQPISMDENSSDSSTKEDIEIKLISEVSTSSEESSSSSDNTDGNSNSPKTDERHIDVPEESNSNPPETPSEENINKEPEQLAEESTESSSNSEEDTKVVAAIQSDNYSISDVNSELPQPRPETPDAPKSPKSPEAPKSPKPQETKEPEEVKAPETIEETKEPEKVELPEETKSEITETEANKES